MEAPTQTPLSLTSWPHIEEMRARIIGGQHRSVEAAAQALATLFTSMFSTVVLARVFAVLPSARLPAADAAIAGEGVAPVLTLLGTSGIEPAWCDRTMSRGHRAIPLSAETMRAAPMIARLLSDLRVELDVKPGEIQTRRLAGGQNSAFYVDDARSVHDSAGRLIIGASQFVASYDVRTVFGMGGTWIDGTWVVVIVFANEPVPRFTVDRFPSLVANFKMATSRMLQSGQLFDA